MTQPAISPVKAARPSLGYAWYVVIVLTAIYMLSFVDRQILSLLVGPIKRDLAISDTRIGLLQGLSFALFYTVMGLPLGRAADKRNRRNLIAGCVLVWSLFTGLCSVAKSFWTLFLTRIGVGVGEAGLSPAAYSMLADYFPSERLGVAISIYYMGVFLGSGAALLVGGSIVDALVRSPLITLPLLGTIASWRVTFLLVGLPGLVFAALVYTVREPLRRDLLKAADGRTAQLSLGQSIAEMGRRWTSFARTFVRDCLPVPVQLRADRLVAHVLHSRAWLDGGTSRPSAGLDSGDRRLPGHLCGRCAERPLVAARRRRSTAESFGD